MYKCASIAMNVFLFSANSKGSSFHVSCPQQLPPLAACQSSMSTSVNDADQQLEATFSFSQTYTQTTNRQTALIQGGRELRGEEA